MTGSKAIDFYVFSWGVSRKPACNLADTAQRKSQDLSHRYKLSMCYWRSLSLCEGPTQTSHLQGKYPWTGEAGIIRHADTKKDEHTVVEIHYNQVSHELTPRGEGASKDCLPKLPRWPFSDAGCTYAPGIAVHGRNGRQPRLESQVFCAASRIFGAPRAASFVVPLLPPASLLALQERTCGQRQEALMSFSTVG
jgi:hypothetical protein